MSAHERSLVGSVFERTKPRTSPVPSTRFTGSPGTGFPTAQHRSKSAFARARDEALAKSKAKAKTTGDARNEPQRIDVRPVPVVSVSRRPTAEVDLKPEPEPAPIPTDSDALHRQIDRENKRAVACMSEEEIEREKRAILEQLGEGAGQLLKRVQEARRRREEETKGGKTQKLEQIQTQRQAPLGRRGKEQEQGAGEAVEGVEDDEAPQASGHGHNVDLACPAPHRPSDGLAIRPGVLRVQSLENIGRSAPTSLPATSSTRPSSRTGRKIRFAEVTPDDVHVYESAPRSPKRAIFALPPPPDTNDDSIVSLGAYNKNVIPSKRLRQMDTSSMLKDDDEQEEGTPEYIRRRYFPGVPPNNPNLAWMDTAPREMVDGSAPRFDLHGNPIPESLSDSLPSHLGLHHHAEGSHAGYTIEDVFLLARSTVPAQRASMLGVLAKIAHRLGLQARKQDSTESMVVFAGQERELRKRILSAGLAAVDQIGSLGARAVEVVWECLVEWDGTTSELEGVELALAPDVVTSLHLDYLLPQIKDVLSYGALPSESLAQLLAILHWLARQSNQLAEIITTTPLLVPTILNRFLLTPIPPMDGSPSPDPLALRLLITLASASRSNALALLDPADALLRFITFLPPSSPYPSNLASSLLTCTLRFYTTLASYGLYSHIATTASPMLTPLASYVISTTPSSSDATNASTSSSIELRVAWTSLVEAWTVCATDPHATNPPHEILWSQICAWGWATDLRQLREGLGHGTTEWKLYAALWNAEGAWLEGARINSVKSGERERDEALQVLGRTFAHKDGIESGIVWSAMETVQRGLAETELATTQGAERVLKSLASAGSVLASALRLWLACLPPLEDGVPLTSPPFSLPMSELSALSATVVKHPVWSFPRTLGATHLEVYLRPLTRFVTHFHRVSRYIPGTTPQLWFAQALAFLSRLLPGDEPQALIMLDAISFVIPQFVGVDPATLPQGIHADILRPFFEYTVRPDNEVYVAPLQPNTESISRSLTLRLPSSSSPLSRSPPGSSDGDDSSGFPSHTFQAGLPVTRDFLFTPLTHLLRSGASPVFRALPGGWTASEVEVVRATLLLAYAARRVLVVYGLDEFVHDAVEVAFACMRVCMLEHGVGVGTDGSSGAETEVFRDTGVERLMELLLEPFSVRGRARADDESKPGIVRSRCRRTFEEVSAAHLGSTPFYQFYTDLVALYGAVSFGHRIFAALVVAPLAMCYEVDYRRAFWCGGDGASTGADARVGQESGHAGAGVGLGDVVRSVRIPIEDVLCTASTGADAREYLYPVERDAAVLGAYVAALVARDGGGGGSARPQGFLRLVAVHHVACTVWGDLEVSTEMIEETEAEAKRREEMRARMVRAVVGRGEADVVRNVVLYQPPSQDSREVKDAGWRAERLALVQRAMGDGATERVGTLLN